MANLTESSSFDPVVQLERSDVIDAGTNGDGLANAQARALANRTKYLKDKADTQQEVLDGLGSAAEADAEDFAPAGAIPSTQKGVAGGVCDLDANGLVPSNRLPPIAINQVFTVASEAAQLALVAEEGDMAVREDQDGQMYVRNSGAAGDMTDWTPVGIQLPIPTDAPTDGKQYARQGGAWAEVVTPDPALIDIIDIDTTDHTLTIDDLGQLLLFNSANSVGVTLTNSVGATDFPVKRQVSVANRGVGDIAVTAPGDVVIKGPVSLSNTAIHSIYRADATTYFVAGKEA